MHRGRSSPSRHSPTRRAGASADRVPTRTRSSTTTATSAWLSGQRYPVRLVRRGRLDAKGVGESHEEVEQRRVVGGFRDLLVAPARIAEVLNLLVCDAVGVARDRFDEL